MYTNVHQGELIAVQRSLPANPSNKKKKKTTIIQTTTEININSNRREGIVGDDTGGEKGKLRKLLPYWKTNSSSPQLA